MDHPGQRSHHPPVAQPQRRSINTFSTVTQVGYPARGHLTGRRDRFASEGDPPVRGRTGVAGGLFTSLLGGVGVAMADSVGADRRDPELEPGQPGGHRFRRSVGLLSAIAINMTQMAGIGPFITIPLIVATFSGSQAIVGWSLCPTGGLRWPGVGNSARQCPAPGQLPVPAGGPSSAGLCGPTPVLMS